jgi:DNA-binding transcriptional MerR regulator/GGDEF domain-containing protein
MERFPSTAEIGRSLKEPGVWSQVQRQLQGAMESLTTSIGQAARIVGMSEPQLRYWEGLGLLSPERATTSESSSRHPGQRRYGMTDLTRMVIIKQLLDQGHSLADISAFMQEGYSSIESLLERAGEETQQDAAWTPERAERAEEGLFWRFFIPRLLYYVICLLAGSVPTGNCTLYLPVGAGTQKAKRPGRIERPEDLPELGKSLLGTYTAGRPFMTYLSHTNTLAKTLDRSTVISLASLAPGEPDTGAHLVVEQNLAELFALPQADEPQALKRQAVKTALALLRQVQAEEPAWRPYAERGSDFMVFKAVDPAFPSPRGDRLLVNLAEMVVKLGGKRKSTAEDRWKFAVILLPADPLLPLQQRNLVVRAQSARAPHIVGATSLPPGPAPSISSRAFQSGHAIYRPQIEGEDPAIFLRKLEGDIHSAIALPIEGPRGQSIAVLYVVSDETEAFSRKEDQLMLRVIGKMIGELVTMYYVRQMMTENLAEMTQNPLIVDGFFSEFASENQFMQDVDDLLKTLTLRYEKGLTHFSLIGVDIDDLSGFTEKYGEQAAKNLVRSVGRRIHQWMDSQRSKTEELKLYRIWADRFYLVMKDVSLETAGDYAEQLQKTLREHPYRIDASRVAAGQSLPSASGIERSITVRLGVTGYTRETLKALLDSSGEVARLRERLTAQIDQALSLGQAAGGDILTMWDQTLNAFASRRYQEQNKGISQASDLLQQLPPVSNEKKAALLEQLLVKLVAQLNP